LSGIALVTGDTDLTPDAGKMSASLQTFVSGAALRLAAEDLRRQVLCLVNADESVCFSIEAGGPRRNARAFGRSTPYACGGGSRRCLARRRHFRSADKGPRCEWPWHFYAAYSFLAQIALVEVDIDLGATKVLRIAAAADVGRAINPTQVEGKLHRGTAQGLGMALMEENILGCPENLQDYLIPSIGDVPLVDTLS
jgi:aldehyde oxidoreductase